MSSTCADGDTGQVLGLYGVDVSSTSTESSTASSTTTSTPSTAPCVASSPTSNITRSVSAPAGARPTIPNPESNQQVSSGTTPRPRLKRNQSRTEAIKKLVSSNFSQCIQVFDFKFILGLTLIFKSLTSFLDKYTVKE